MPFRDNSDRMVTLLEQIAQNVGGPQAVDKDIMVNEEGQSVSGRFFSSGENRISAPASDGEWESMEFPFPVNALSIRHYDSLEICFENPNNTTNIVVLEADGDFSIGGDPSFGADTLWYRTHDSASVTNAEFRVEGY